MSEKRSCVEQQWSYLSCFPILIFFSCLCNDACNCSAHQATSSGSEYVNRQRSWSNGSSHSLQTPKPKSYRKAGNSAPPTPLNLSPSVTPNLSRNGSKLSSIQGGDINQEKSDDICIVVTDAEPSKSPCPWGGSDKGASGDMWTANFIPITEEEQNSPKKKHSTPGILIYKKSEMLKMLNCVNRLSTWLNEKKHCILKPAYLSMNTLLRVIKIINVCDQFHLFPMTAIHTVINLSSL